MPLGGASPSRSPGERLILRASGPGVALRRSRGPRRPCRRRRRPASAHAGRPPASVPLSAAIARAAHAASSAPNPSSGTAHEPASPDTTSGYGTAITRRRGAIAVSASPNDTRSASRPASREGIAGASWSWHRSSVAHVRTICEKPSSFPPMPTTNRVRPATAQRSARADELGDHVLASLGGPVEQQLRAQAATGREEAGPHPGPRARRVDDRQVRSAVGQAPGCEHRRGRGASMARRVRPACAPERDHTDHVTGAVALRHIQPGPVRIALAAREGVPERDDPHAPGCDPRRRAEPRDTVGARATRVDRISGKAHPGGAPRRPDPRLKPGPAQLDQLRAAAAGANAQSDRSGPVRRAPADDADRIVRCDGPAQRQPRLHGPPQPDRVTPGGRQRHRSPLERRAKILGPDYEPEISSRSRLRSAVL